MLLVALLVLSAWWVWHSFGPCRCECTRCGRPVRDHPWVDAEDPEAMGYRICRPDLGDAG